MFLFPRHRDLGAILRQEPKSALDALAAALTS
jgi:hypothetical protein